MTTTTLSTLYRLRSNANEKLEHFRMEYAFGTNFLSEIADENEKKNLDKPNPDVLREIIENAKNLLDIVASISTWEKKLSEIENSILVAKTLPRPTFGGTSGFVDLDDDPTGHARRAYTMARTYLSTLTIDELREDARAIVDSSGSSSIRYLAYYDEITSREYAENYPKEETTVDPEACPTCGGRPGDGLTVGCDDENGCGFWRREEEIEKNRTR